MFILLVFGFLAGLATVLSPCILPILPIILSGAVGERRRPYGIISGFVLSFAAFTIFAAAIVQSLGIDLDSLRLVAAIILALLGLVLIFPKLQYWLNSLFKIKTKSDSSSQGFWGGFGTGATLGLIWAPCAGPILAAVITLAATANSTFGSFLVTLFYALGTGSIMLVIVLAGRRLLEKIKKLYAHLETIHKVFGVLVLIAALGIATGYDRKVQTAILNITPEGWTTFLQRFENAPIVNQAIEDLQQTATDKKVPKVNLSDDNKNIKAPELASITAWLNSEPLTIEQLKGKVVLIDFWTYSCINCLRTLPYLKDWDDKYRDDGLVIIGVHAPEFPFEKKLSNVEKAVVDLGLKYPIALDNDFATWNNYNNSYWPAKYFIDRDGYIRHHHFGEGEYEESEKVIQYLLAESGTLPTDEISQVKDEDYNVWQTPETYLGYWRLERFQNESEVVRNQVSQYDLDNRLSNDQWTIGGSWIMMEKDLFSAGSDARLQLKFNAKDVYLVMGAETPTKIRILLDGQAISSDQAGPEVDDIGEILVSDYKLYHLVSAQKFQSKALLELQIPAGVQLNAFTFGS